MQSLWEKLGGDSALRAIVDDFVTRILTNPRVNYTRNGRYPQTEATLAAARRGALEFISMATGGPYRYTGRSLPEIHQDMAIRDEEFDAVCEDFQRALGAHGVEPLVVRTAMELVVATRPLIVQAPAPRTPKPRPHSNS